MTFLYSLKLFKSNFVKSLKLFLSYLVVWGICLCLLLPVIFEFSQLISEAFKEFEVVNALSGVFRESVGVGLHNLFEATFQIASSCWQSNSGLMIYGLIVVFVIMPILLNICNYTFSEMLHSYMSSKRKIGFFSALVKGLRKSFFYALERTFFGLFFYAVIFGAIYGLTLIDGADFVKIGYPIILFVMFVLCFTFRQVSLLGFMPALIVFDCSHFTARKKGFKAVVRHFLPIFLTTLLYFTLFWLLAFVFGAFSLVVLIPIMAILMNNFNMVAFFCSQGMRFYFDNEHILTPKKLEEVDNIKKISAIL